MLRKKNILKGISLSLATLASCVMLSTASFASDFGEVGRDTMMESFKEDLNKRGIGEENLIGTENQYYEVVKKSDLTDEELKDLKIKKDKELSEEFVAIKKSKDDYLAQTIKEADTPMLRSVWGDGTSRQSSWMKLKINLYENGSKFTVYSFWEWLSEPLITRTDINNIYFSSNVTTVQGTVASYYEAWKRDLSGSLTGTPYQSTPPVEYNIKGLAQKTNLLTLNSKSWHRGYLGTDVQFRTPMTGQIGDIYTEYIHTTIKLSSFGFDSTGTVAIGAGWGADRLSGPYGKIYN